MTEPLPTEIAVGGGTVVVVRGWAFHPAFRVRSLRVRVLTAGVRVVPGHAVDPHEAPDGELAGHRVRLGERPARVIARRLASPDAVAAHFPHDDPHGFSRRAGFLAEFVVPRLDAVTRAEVVVEATLADGRIATAGVAAVTLLPERHREPAPAPPGDGPLIAVCMATYNPPPALFVRQIASLRKQTWRRWVCVIRDDASDPAAWDLIRRTVGTDPRFVVRRNETNLGFYANFETALGDVPTSAALVALADQDDEWDADKLEQMHRHFEPGIAMVFSDVRLTTPTGAVLSPTYWTTRDMNAGDYPSLLLANTVTGAATMFRRSLLDHLLPFPVRVGGAYHDHWLALVAAAVGHVHYIPQPLSSYVQHDGQVIGHTSPHVRMSWRARVRSTLGWLNPLAFRRNVRAARNTVRDYLHAGACEHAQIVRVAAIARAVQARCGTLARPEVAAGLREAVSWRDGRLGAYRLLRRGLRRNATRLTCGVEWNLLRSRVWAAVDGVVGSVAERLTAAGLRAADAGQAAGGLVLPHAGLSDAISGKVAPLTLSVRPTSPDRVNVVVSVIDFKYLFGGYLTVFHLCRLLADRGWRVRLVIVDPCDFRPADWAYGFRRYRGLEDLLDRVDLAYVADRRVPLPAGPGDVFLATSCWTAHVAHAAARTLGRDRFVYLIQEYETGFHPLGSEAAFAAESYTLPHFALFSTALLRDYFREQRLGVFAGADGDRTSTSFENAITTVGAVDPKALARRKKKRVLFYCRPEAHAARNLFEVGLLGLRKAVAAGAFRGWEFHGVGSVDVFARLDLSNGATLTMLPRMTQEEYRAVLPNYDVGLALMYTPHPSLVPLEMAAAGMCTVTTTYANKTADRLREVSANLIPVEGTVSAVAAGLGLAERAAADFPARAAAADVRWATTWDEAFPVPLLNRLDGFFRSVAADEHTTNTPARRAAA